MNEESIYSFLNSSGVESRAILLPHILFATAHYSQGTIAEIKTAPTNIRRNNYTFRTYNINFQGERAKGIAK